MSRVPAGDTQLSAARRRFLRAGGSATVVAAAALTPLGSLLAAAGFRGTGSSSGYGPLAPVRDLSTGLPLLQLPDGFSYRSFGWTGEPMMDGTPTPGAHDGMGIVRVDGSIATLVRNHEQVGSTGAFGPAASRYDPACSGGTATLRFDLDEGRPLDAHPSLSGTLQNCSGGTTPWGSWLSCEEFVCREGFSLSGRRLARAHGFVFEVPAEGGSDAEPLLGLGQFRHEAAAVHAPSGHVYLTEDLEPIAGFYRFVPDRGGRLGGGGRLQMLKVRGRQDLREGLVQGQRFAAEWVAIDQPAHGVVGGADIRGVQKQGLARGAAKFTRLEGCFATADEVFFTATNGGDAGSGQVFCYLPASSELVLVYESPSPRVLAYPDNVCVSPRGGLVLCQDAKGAVQHLYGLTRDGELFAFARNNVLLDGTPYGFAGDFRTSEWAGACFSPDGRWLFANLYRPGFTVAITGPWRSGLV